jgi:hypothetical protein
MAGAPRHTSSSAATVNPLARINSAVERVAATPAGEGSARIRA